MHPEGQAPHILITNHAPEIFTLIRELVTVTGEGYHVTVAYPATVGEAQDALTTTDVDVVVIGFELDAQERLDLVRTLREARSPSGIIMLTGNLDEQARAVAKAADAVGIEHRSISIAELAATVRRAADGTALLSPAEVLQDAARRQAQHEEAQRALQHLTRREVDVLRALVAGLDNPGIAERLSITERTVHTHVDRILRKLHVTSRLQAVLMGLRSGFLDLSDLE